MSQSASLATRIAGLDLEAAPGTRGAGLSDAVLSALRQGIRSGLIQPGDRLREEEIAEHFSVSRTPVRDALRRLLERRFLEVSGARGLMVRRLDRAEVFELYQMREILEGTAARFAAENASRAEIDLLTDLHGKFEAATDPAEWQRLNKQFHETIAGAVRNRFFHSPLDELQDFLALLGPTTFSVIGRASPAAAEHQRILDAIARHDPDAAEAAARDHIRSALSTRLRMLAA
ncbi:GntR family transcriptional regulator [Gemmobacter serpentinus]|uniref:GntR family transcriptional regulator n=1 Tax=Gemmobacter serpentinus TaxID=2652247 RepID=UPI00124D7251|nr:GntR family transcriptional regulator [Gemmobacter serpentinus]